MKLAWLKTSKGRRSLRWVAALALLLSLAVAANLALDWLYELPGVRLQRIVLKGDLERVDRARLRATLLGAARGSFFTVDVQAVQREVLRLPWVRSAAVRRVWPDRLEVTLEEHVPRARWGTGQLLNSRDEVFSADYSGDLPRLYGPPGSEKEVAQRMREFTAILAPIGERPVETVLSARRAWHVKLAGGLTLALGRSDALPRLERFVTVARAYPELAERRGQIDLRYANGFAVKFAAPKAGTDPSPKKKAR